MRMRSLALLRNAPDAVPAGRAGIGARRGWGPSPRAFAVQLAFILLALLASRPYLVGDFFEYWLTTIAIARHGTPDVRADDAALAAALAPDANYRALFDGIRDDIARGGKDSLPGLHRGKDGDMFPIHFFAYPALAAPAFRLLQGVGANPMKAFQVVNFAAFWLLGLVLHRFFGSARRAFVGLGLVLGTGGILYINWGGPEMVTACACLAGTLLFVLGRPLAGGLLAGVAAMQNPSLVFVAAFAPLFSLLHDRAEGRPHPFTGRRAVLGDARLHGALLLGVLALLPFAFGLWQWHVPSIIGRDWTDPRLVGPQRLFSYYFDLDQGMILAVPGILLLLAGIVPRRPVPRLAAVLALLFMLALAVPTLSAQNWNPGGVGILRYVFWGAMPLLLLAFGWLRTRSRWPLALLCAAFALQAAAMVHAKKYGHTEFSPLARLVLAHAPALYNPDPEIFFERSRGTEDGMDIHGVVVWPRQGPVRKVLFNVESRRVDEVLCPRGQRLSGALPLVERRDGWRYLNGAPACVPAAP